MRILIVDDADALRTVLTHILASLGHEIAAHVADGEAALSVALRTRPDAIAVDGRLGPPGVLPLLTALRSALPEANLLLVASLGETALVRAAREAGAAGVLSRPFLRSRVAAALQELEGARRAPER